jgi:hypothetical protein
LFSYVILRGHWYDVIVLNVSLRNYEELEHVFDQFPEYHLEILVGHFIAKIAREDVLKPAI